MPAIINLAANVILGCSLTLALRRSAALRAEVLSWVLMALMAFEALVFTPIATYLFRFFPQWSMLYWFDPQLFPELDRWVGLLSLVAVLANFLAALGGYLSARAGIITGKTHLWLVPLLASGLIIITVLVAYPDRVAYMGDYDEFWQGNAVFLFRRLAGWLGVLLYASAVGLVFWLHARFATHDPRWI